MGIIDTTEFRVKCPKCGLTESVEVYQKGSAYNPYWQDRAEMKTFDAQWTGGDKEARRITKAICIACGCEALVEESGTFPHHPERSSLDFGGCTFRSPHLGSGRGR